MAVKWSTRGSRLPGAQSGKSDGIKVGDRQKTAQRLLRSTADRSYDGELDIDWDVPTVPGKPWVPEHRVSLYGTKLWETLTDEQRLTLGMHEIVSILSYGIFAEVGLSTNLLRGIFANPDLVDDHMRYALAEVAEETRHSTMFGRVINITGVPPYKRPAFLMRTMRIIGFVPLGPSMYAGTLLIEEVLDRLQREGLMDLDVQPHLRQMAKIHILEEARHITYAREELVRSIEERGRFANACHRGIFAVLVHALLPTLIHPGVYRSVGIHPVRGLIAARRSPLYKANSQFMCGPLVSFLYDAGMVKGAITTRLFKLSGTLPDDVLAKVAADRKKS